VNIRKDEARGGVRAGVWIARTLLAALSACAAMQCQRSGNTGAPSETQRSGFGGERTSSGMSEPARLRGGERYAACEDDAAQTSAAEI